jgi:hypothetical protein
LLSGDVRVEVEWLLHEQDRYESDAAPDVDNILKPLLDSLCGPQGLLIDDCQVQALDSRWIDWPDRGQRVQIRLRFFPDEWVSKDGLCFVHLGKSLYFPINRFTSAQGVLLIMEHVKAMLKTRNRLMELGEDYYTSNGVMSVQRAFHRSRIGRFPVMELLALQTELEQQIARRSRES